MAYKITSAVATEPLSLAEAKDYLRVEHSVDDTLIGDLITSARAQVESLTGRALASHTVEEFYDRWPDNGVIELKLTPVTAVTSVEYIASGGTSYTSLPAAGNWAEDTVSIPVRIVRLDTGTFPDLEATPNAVKVTYSAGLTGNQNDRVLSIARQIIRFLVAADYERRTDPVTRTSQNTIRRTEQLIRQIKAF